MSCVVNVHVDQLRPKYANLKEWMRHSNHIYIGRARIVLIDGERFPPKPSLWANPFKLDSSTMTREQVLEKYEMYLLELLEKRPELRDELKTLQGKILGCWCKPEACHGDVLIKVLSTLS